MTSNALYDFAVPLRTLDPADPDTSDLAPFRALIGDARVVSIGESAHLVREFYQLKDRLFRFLVSELGFTAFVMESGFPEGLAVNDWVLGGGGDLEAIAAAGITYGFDCAELRDQLHWMRDWNAAHDRKVRFYGLDVPGSVASPGPPIEACLARLDPRPDDVELRRLADLGSRVEATLRYPAMPAVDRQRLSAAIKGLVERAQAGGDEIAYRCALATQRLDELLVSDLQAPAGRNPRDELMADNVRWILEREDRIVIGAHNGHILRGAPFGMPMLGQLLAPELGNDMVVIGTTYASGEVVNVRNMLEAAKISDWDVALEPLPPPPPNTIDALMESVGLPRHLVDLRRVPDALLSEATAMYVHHQAVPLRSVGAFDALVHIQRVSTVSGGFETLRDQIDQADAPAPAQ